MSHKQGSLFITSADHDIGHNLARFIISSELKDCFKEIVCGGTNQERLDDLKRQGLKTVTYKLDDKHSLAQHMKGMNMVYVIPPFREHEPRHGCHLIDAAKEANVSCILLQSNLMADKANSPMMKQYVECEHHLQQVQVKHKAVVRIGHLTDTFLYMANHIQQQGEIPLPTGDEKFAPIRLRDVSRAVAYVLSGKKHQQGRLVDVGTGPSFLPKYTHGKMELTGPESLTGEQVVQRASQAVGAQFKFKSAEPREVERILKESEDLEQNEIKLILEEYCLIKEGQFDHVSKDYEKITGRQASKVDEFFEENAHNFKPQK
jgi:NAD(P)H dehydrogenase (quinone)